MFHYLCFSIWKWIQTLSWAEHFTEYCTSVELTWEIQSKLIAIENLSRLHWVTTIGMCVCMYVYCQNIQQQLSTPNSRRLGLFIFFSGFLLCILIIPSFIECCFLSLSMLLIEIFSICFCEWAQAFEHDICVVCFSVFNSLAMDSYLNRLINLGFRVCVI